MLRLRIPHRRTVSLLKDAQGAALLEFAISLPLLVVFIVGIYDFSGAFNQKQKIEQAAQEGAIIAGAQPTSDIASSSAPDSLLPVVSAVYNSLVGSGVLPTGTCTPPGTASGPTGLAWTYTLSGCPDSLIITINRGAVVNSDTVINQIEGATVMALGGALFEAIHFTGGRITNGTFSDYRVPRIDDVPSIEVVLLDRADLPSAGAGETPMIAVAPAIANAVFDATGHRLRSLPLRVDGPLHPGR